MLARARQRFEFLPPRLRPMRLIPGIVAGGGGGGGVVGGDPFYDDVVSLLHFEGANGSTTFTDEKGITWTPAGNAQIATSTPKFGLAAGSFDGTTDYLDANDAVFTFGVDDFTLECWGRFDSVTGNRALFGLITNRTVYNFNVGTPTLALFDGAANQSTIAGTALNTYYHIAWCRAAGISRVFRDGVPGADFTDSQNFTTTTCSVARFPGSTISTLLGFVDEFRVTRRARYTDAFTAPVAAFDNFRAALQDPHYASVVALLNCEGPNGRTWILDERGNKWIRTGTGAITTAQTPGFGTSSLDDPNSTSYYSTASKAALAMGTGDFTVEWFARPTNLTGIKIWYDQRTALNQTRPAVFCDGDVIKYFVSNADRITSAAGAVVINTWHHIALSRASGSTRLFVNGAQVGSTYADATNYDAGPIIWGQAGDNLGGAFGFIGQNKGLRVTKGVARYTANFTPPAALFPNS